MNKFLRGVLGLLYGLVMGIFVAIALPFLSLYFKPNLVGIWAMVASAFWAFAVPFVTAYQTIKASINDGLLAGLKAPFNFLSLLIEFLKEGHLFSRGDSNFGWPFFNRVSEPVVEFESGSERTQRIARVQNEEIEKAANELAKKSTMGEGLKTLPSPLRTIIVGYAVEPNHSQYDERMFKKAVETAEEAVKEKNMPHCQSQADQTYQPRNSPRL